jgi:outer membrane protein assembly factor BamB/orotate phosphoribosyltransferase
MSTSKAGSVASETTTVTTTTTVSTKDGKTTITTTTTTNGNGAATTHAALAESRAAAVATSTLPDDPTDEQILEYVRKQPDWEMLRKQIITHAINFADGIVFDGRRALTIARNAEAAGRLMWQLIKPYTPAVLVGPGFGAAPLLYGTALAALADGVTLTVLMVRDKRKEHNQKKWVEGKRPPQGARAVAIDDFMERGSAVGLVDQALESDGIKLNLRAFAVFFDMWEPLGSRQIATGRFPVLALFKRHDIGLSRDCYDAKPPLMKGSYPDFVPEKPVWWRLGLNDKTGYQLKCAPVIAENAVFVADDHCHVWRHDALTGNIDWEYESLEDHLKGIVQVLQYADKSLVFGCYDGTVTRLDAQTGKVIWRWRQDSSVHATPELDLEKGLLFINTEQYNNGAPFGHLQALSWKTGRLVWKYAHAYWPPGSPILDRATRTVFATCNDATLIAVDADTGELRWKKKTEGLVRGRPGILKGRVFVATETGRLQAFASGTGEHVWTTRYGRGEFHQFVHTDGDLVYALDGRWHFSAFEASTGAIRWVSRVRSTGNWGPTTFGKYLLVLSRDGDLAVYDPGLELKVWEGRVRGFFRQPCATGWIRDKGKDVPVLAAASNTSGLQLFHIHPHYATKTNGAS